MHVPLANYYATQATTIKTGTWRRDFAGLEQPGGDGLDGAELLGAVADGGDAHAGDHAA